MLLRKKPFRRWLYKTVNTDLELVNASDGAIITLLANFVKKGVNNFGAVGKGVE